MLGDSLCMNLLLLFDAQCNGLQVCADATILFPLLISQTFAKNFKPKE